MSILTLNDGNWVISSMLVPNAFWDYTSIVTKVVMSLPRDQVRGLHEDLIHRFRSAGISAHTDNKTVFEFINREDRKLWYFGFKDLQFNLGLGILTDPWLKPVTQ